MIPVNIRFKAHLTEEHQLKAADQLIAKLQQKSGADEAYILELESDKDQLQKQISDLQKELETTKMQLKKISNKYSDDVQQFIRTDILYQKYKDSLDAIKKERDNLKSQRDHLLYQLSNVR